VAEAATRDACALAAKAASAGADGLMVVPSTIYHTNHRETIATLRAIAAAGDLPIMIYSNRLAYRVDVTTDMLEELADDPHFVAVKESSDDIRRSTEIINRLGTRYDLFTGVDNLAFEALAVGAVGWVAGLVVAFPKETVAIYRLMQAGRQQEALAIYRWFRPLLDLDVSSYLVQNIKLAEAMAIGSNERVRAPRLPLEGEQRARAEARDPRRARNASAAAALRLRHARATTCWWSARASSAPPVRWPCARGLDGRPGRCRHARQPGRHGGRHGPPGRARRKRRRTRSVPAVAAPVGPISSRPIPASASRSRCGTLWVRRTNSRWRDAQQRAERLARRGWQRRPCSRRRAGAARAGAARRFVRRRARGRRQRGLSAGGGRLPRQRAGARGRHAAAWASAWRRFARTRWCWPMARAWWPAASWWRPGCTAPRCCRRPGGAAQGPPGHYRPLSGAPGAPGGEHGVRPGGVGRDGLAVAANVQPRAGRPVAGRFLPPGRPA
jgi:dihydrodipicolinate synthase/N-acetylneuraminate lyase